MKQNFEDMATTILGDYGETLIEPILKENGWNVLNKPKGRHPYDFNCYKFSNTWDKWLYLEADAKVCQRRIEYNDNGINLNEFEVYKDRILNHNVNFVIYFIDEVEECIYELELSNLIREEEERIEKARKKYNCLLDALGTDNEYTNIAYYEIKPIRYKIERMGSSGGKVYFNLDDEAIKKIRPLTNDEIQEFIKIRTEVDKPLNIERWDNCHLHFKKKQNKNN